MNSHQFKEHNTKHCRIWGSHFILEGFNTNEIKELFDEFCGAVEPVADNDTVPARRLVRVPQLDPVPKGQRLEKDLRHSGGSSGNKRYPDGTWFQAESQERYQCTVGKGDIFYADDCLILSTDETLWIVGTRASGPLLCDLVENILLNNAKKNGWVQCHAAAWTDADGCKLLTGDSGRGKTTALLKAVKDGADFISNDRVFLRLSDGNLEARGYPLSMNVGFGTIRSLELDYPDFGDSDTTKLRLSPDLVDKSFKPKYSTWYPVLSIKAQSLEELMSNSFFEPDPTHPSWIPQHHKDFDEVVQANIIEKMHELLEQIT